MASTGRARAGEDNECSVCGGCTCPDAVRVVLLLRRTCPCLRRAFVVWLVAVLVFLPTRCQPLSQSQLWCACRRACIISPSATNATPPRGPSTNLPGQSLCSPSFSRCEPLCYLRRPPRDSVCSSLLHCYCRVLYEPWLPNRRCKLPRTSSRSSTPPPLVGPRLCACG
jgi:hypothetical protein